MKVIKCIFCEETKEGTAEHIFPQFIGGTRIIEEVCKDCNSKLGSDVDSPLINNVLMEFYRYIYNLKSQKNNRFPNPFRKVILSDDREIHKRLDKDGNFIKWYFPPEKEETEDEIIFSVDESEVGILDKMVKREIERQGLPKETYNQIMSNVKININSPIEAHVDSEVSYFNWNKGILKIAFEMSYSFFGIEFLNEPVTKNVRKVLKDEMELYESDIYCFVSFTHMYKEYTKIFKNFVGPELLTALLMEIDNSLYVYINIFDVFEGQFVLSENAEKYFKEDFNMIYYSKNVRTKALDKIKYLRIK